MQISKQMINYYLDGVTVSWFNDHELLPDNVQEYLPLVDGIKKRAFHHGDLKYLKIAFEYLLAHPEINYEEFSGGRYPYDSEEIQEIIEFAYNTIWADAPPISPEQLPDVHLIQIPLEEWWAMTNNFK